MIYASAVSCILRNLEALLRSDPLSRTWHVLFNYGTRQKHKQINRRQFFVYRCSLLSSKCSYCSLKFMLQFSSPASIAFPGFFFLAIFEVPKAITRNRVLTWYKFTKISKERAVYRPHDVLSQNTKCYGWFVKDRHKTSCPVSRTDLMSSSKYARPLISRTVKFYIERHKFLPSTMPQRIADSVHCVRWTMQGIE